MRKKFFTVLLSLCFLGISFHALANEPQPGKIYTQTTQEEPMEDVWLDAPVLDDENFRPLGLAPAEEWENQNFTRTKIVGSDNRKNITGRATGAGMAAVILTSTFLPKNDVQQTVCSGAMVGINLVLTAAHCVYQPRWGGMAASVVVDTPGLKRSQRSYGIQAPWIPADYKNKRTVRNDYALITLHDPLGNLTGTLRLAIPNKGIYDTNDHNKFPVRVFGRGTDRPVDTLWESSGQVGEVIDGFLFTSADTFNGNSGGPVVTSSGKIIGVLSGDLHLLDWLGLNSIKARWCHFYPNVAAPVTQEIINIVADQAAKAKKLLYQQSKDDKGPQRKKRHI